MNAIPPIAQAGCDGDETDAQPHKSCPVGAIHSPYTEMETAMSQSKHGTWVSGTLLVIRALGPVRNADRPRDRARRVCQTYVAKARHERYSPLVRPATARYSARGP
jgi:hypothetical protein